MLIIKTATRLSDELKIEIHTIEVRLKANQTIVSFKKRLDELNKNMLEFEATLKNSKIVKLKRDIAKFSHERVYPYIKKDYINPNDPEGRGPQTDSSDGAGTSDSGSSNEEYGGRDSNMRRPRRNRRGRNWGPPAPFYPPVHQGPFYGPPPPSFGPYPNHFGYPLYQQPRGPFLGYGQQRRRQRGRTNTSVQWEDEQEQRRVETRSMTASTSKAS